MSLIEKYDKKRKEQEGICLSDFGVSMVEDMELLLESLKDLMQLQEFVHRFPSFKDDFERAEKVIEKVEGKP